MADASGSPPPAGSSELEIPPSGSEPPPLLDVRVKGRRPKGLNKKAIVGVAGGGLAIVLIFASSGLSPDKGRKPSSSRPPMSDPAMSTMAEARVRDLPADYGEAEAFSARQGADVPLLGPPLPGDIGAFSASRNEPENIDDPYDPNSGWPNSGRTGREYVAPNEPDPAEMEAKDALRSGLFFALRDDGQPRATDGMNEPPLARPTHPLTALAPAPTPSGQDASLHPGSVIAASLVTAIDSEAPGPVIAQVTHPVYDSLGGRILLIPQGARLIGDYSSTSKHGQSRLAIFWSRLIMPDGEEIALDEAAVDPAGSAGVKGKVDNHWGDVFGAAALGTLINIGVATTEERPSIGVTFTGVGSGVGEGAVDDALRDGVQRSAAIVTNRVVDRALAVAPTIRINAGVKVSVIVTRRLAF